MVSGRPVLLVLLAEDGYNAYISELKVFPRKNGFAVLQGLVVPFGDCSAMHPGRHRLFEKYQLNGGV